MNFFKAKKEEKKTIFKALLHKLFYKEDKRKLRKLVEGKNFDFFIMSIILADAVVLGLMTTDFFSYHFESGLFLLDRLFMGIFIVEMFMKIYSERTEFFKSGWNIFDLTIVVVSSVPAVSALIILRSFRLFRLLKYVHHASRVNNLINTFIFILPSFVSFAAVFAVFFYVFSIISVSMFGEIFIEFSDLGSAMKVMLQTLTLEGWSVGIAHQVMRIFPNAWVFFAAQSVIMFLLMVSFLLTVIADVVQTALKK